MPSPSPSPAPDSQSLPTEPLTGLTSPNPHPERSEGHDNLTRSQRLFATATGIDARALQVTESHEFHLFMDMREEKAWQSFSMTPKAWTLATNEYNARLQRLCTEKGLPQPVDKNPLALLRKLGEIEPQLINRLLSNNFACECVLLHPKSPPLMFLLQQQATVIQHSGRGTAMPSLLQQSPKKKM